MGVVHHRHGGDDRTLLHKHGNRRQGSVNGSPLLSGVDRLLVVVVYPCAFGKIHVLCASTFLHHRSYQQFTTEQELGIRGESFHIHWIFQKQRPHDRQSCIIRFSGVSVDIRQQTIFQLDSRFRVLFRFRPEKPRFHRVISLMVDTTQRIKCSELNPTGIEFRHSRIILNIPTVTGDITGRKWD